MTSMLAILITTLAQVGPPQRFGPAGPNVATQHEIRAAIDGEAPATLIVPDGIRRFLEIARVGKPRELIGDEERPCFAPVLAEDEQLPEFPMVPYQVGALPQDRPRGRRSSRNGAMSSAPARQ